MINLEISLIKAFGWSLSDIDRTSIESLIPFVMQLTESDGNERRKFIDEVDGF